MMNTDQNLEGESMIIPSAVKPLLKADPILAKIIHQIPPPEWKSTGEVFHDLMGCVLEQQIHYRSSKKIYQKMLERAGLSILLPHHFERFEAQAFEGIKLSMKKYETVMTIAERWPEIDTDWQKLSDEAVQERLSQIKGIGPWTIEMILLYTLKRPNIFPSGDFHLKQIMTALYQLNPKAKLKAQMMEIAQEWSDQRSLAVLYLLDWKKHQQAIARKNKKK